jgi:hypothetical protein
MITARGARSISGRGFQIVFLEVSQETYPIISALEVTAAQFFFMAGRPKFKYGFGSFWFP